VEEVKLRKQAKEIKRRKTSEGKQTPGVGRMTITVSVHGSALSKSSQKSIKDAPSATYCWQEILVRKTFKQER